MCVKLRINRYAWSPIVIRFAPAFVNSRISSANVAAIVPWPTKSSAPPLGRQVDGADICAVTRQDDAFPLVKRQFEIAGKRQQ
jgi:hypothetical protein